MSTIELSPNPRFSSTEYLRQYDDAATWVAEVLDGPMSSSFDFGFDGRELLDRAGRPLGKIFADGLRQAKNQANFDPRLAFEVGRREHEGNEYADMISLAKGELPNTMVVVSDFPAALAAATENLGGYDIKRRQAMLRVITAQPNGLIRIESQSLDGSYRFGLEAIYNLLGFTPQAGELLGQRLHKQLTAAEQSQLLQRLTQEYDDSLAAWLGGRYRAGRGDNGANTYEFVLQQTELLDYFAKQAIEQGVTEDDLYNLAAAITNRWEMASSDCADCYIRIDQFGPQQELAMAGQLAHNQNKEFSGCGLTLGGKLELPDGETALQALGYGNKETVLKCVTCPLCNKKGVDAHIKYEKGRKVITCSDCHKSKIY